MNEAQIKHLFIVLRKLVACQWCISESDADLFDLYLSNASDYLWRVRLPEGVLERDRIDRTMRRREDGHPVTDELVKHYIAEAAGTLIDRLSRETRPRVSRETNDKTDK